MVKNFALYAQKLAFSHGCCAIEYVRLAQFDVALEYARSLMHIVVEG
jgi:hypothetical protein